TMIVVEKGAKKERFEITRDANTKASGEMKVGDKVTVHYTMTATNIEVKPAKAEKGAKKEAAKPAASPKQETKNDSNRRIARSVPRELVVATSLCDVRLRPEGP